MERERPLFGSRLRQFFENLNANLIELKEGQLPIYRGKVAALKRDRGALKARIGEEDERHKSMTLKISGLENLIHRTERDVNLGRRVLQNPPRPEGWVLVGEVVDPQTGIGMSNVRVRLFDRQGEPATVVGEPVTATTDEHGCFHMDCTKKDFKQFLAEHPEVTVKVYDQTGKVIHVESGVRPMIGGLNLIQVLTAETNPACKK